MSKEASTQKKTQLDPSIRFDRTPTCDRQTDGQTDTACLHTFPLLFPVAILCLVVVQQEMYECGCKIGQTGIKTTYCNIASRG